MVLFHLCLPSLLWRVYACIRFKKFSHIDFLELHEKQEKCSKRHIKSNFCVAIVGKIWKNGLVDSFVIESFFKCQCMMKWDKYRGSHFTYYTTHVAPNYKNICFVEKGNHTHQYMLECILLSSV